MRKKFLQGAATLSMAAAVCIMSGLVTASADALPEEKVTVDYEKQQIIVDLKAGGSSDVGGSGMENPDDTETQAEGDETTDPVPDTPAAGTTGADHEILFNVASVDKNKKLKASAWEVYDVTDDKVVIDITSLNTQKDNYVQIKGDVSKDPLTLFIPATDKTLKLKFNAYTAQAEFNKGADASKTADYEYRTQYSDWSDAAKLGDISLKMYQERGAKLYFRLSAAASAETVKEGGKAVTGITDKATTKALEKVYQMKSLPGKEIKVSVSKKANAPKASVNYTKGAVTIPAGALYRVNDENGLGEFSKTATSAKVTLNSASTGADKTAYDALVAGGSLEVKKAGDATKKKSESKVFQLAFPNPKAVLDVGGEEAAKKTVTENVVKDPTDDKKTIAVTTIAENKDKKQAVTSFKITVKNDTDYNYEVVVDKATPGADKKGKVIKAGKSVDINRIDKGGSTVWIRRCADQKKAEWATDYIQMGVIPAASTTTPDTPGTDETKVTEADLQAFAAEYIANPVLLATSGVAQGDPVDIGASGKGFTWASKDYKVTVDDTEKTLKGVTVAVKSVTNNALLPALDETNTSDGIKYGSGCANIGLMTADNAPSAIVTITCGDVSYEHTLTFSKQS